MKVKIKNKPLFWTGLSFQIIQFSVIGIIALTLLDWSWFTLNVLKGILVVSAILFYNGISLTLIFSGLKFKRKKKGGKK